MSTKLRVLHIPGKIKKHISQKNKRGTNAMKGTPKNMVLKSQIASEVPIGCLLLMKNPPIRAIFRGTLNRINKQILWMALFAGLLGMQGQCRSRETPVDKRKLIGMDFRLYQGTPAWELAKAVEDEDLKEIERQVREKGVPVDYPEERFGNTLLGMAVMRKKLQSAKKLLELGADPNRKDEKGETPFLAALGHFYFPEVIEPMLKHGADVNYKLISEGFIQTPLGEACDNSYRFRGNNFEVVRLLVEAGADVNSARGSKDLTAVGWCIFNDQMQSALYLLRHGADYKGRSGLYDNILENLRASMEIPLDSPQHRYKMEIVKFLKEKGLDYHSYPIPDYVVKDVKKRYPLSWREYLQKY